MLGFVRRYVVRRWTGREVGIYFHPEYALSGPARSLRVAHVEPRRGVRVVDHLARAGWISASEVRPPEVASVEDLLTFHTASYIESTMDPSVLGRVFGVPAEDIDDVEPLLRSARRQVGGTVEAARFVLGSPDRVAVNLGGGFHHAEPDQGSGFCIYNDIGVAIERLRRDGFAGKIATIDLDFHQGNGLVAAYARDPAVLTYSIHGAVWSRQEALPDQIHLTGVVTDKRYLSVLRTMLHGALDRIRPDLVFYLAGTDVLAHDRLGGFWLSLDGVMDRDRHVSELCLERKIPMVVTLGGGYSPLAWHSTMFFVRWLLGGPARADRRLAPSREVRFDRIARALEPFELSPPDGGLPTITLDDVLGDLGERPRQRRFLDFYTRSGMELAFERYGLFEKVRQRGFRRLDLEVEASDPARQVLRLRGVRPPSPTRHLLFELVVRRGLFEAPYAAGAYVEALFVEWLLLQDPTRSFTLERPPLPGQRYPGLGIAGDAQLILRKAAERLGLGAVVDRPSHVHNCLGGSKETHFIDPTYEGRLLAMLTVLAGRAPAEAAALVHDGRLVLSSGERLLWVPADHAIAVAPGFVAYFESPAYRGAARTEMSRLLAEGLKVEPPPAESAPTVRESP